MMIMLCKFVYSFICCFIQAVGGFAGPGTVTFSDTSPEPVVASEADSFVVEGVFARADGEPLEPSTILYLYIFQGTSSGSAAEALRGTAAVDPTTGAFTAAVTDAPAGDSTLVMSFVLGLDGGSGEDGRRLVEAAGTGSVYTVPVVNPTDCANALAITLEWTDGASDIDLWVLEPGGQDVGWTNLSGVGPLLWRFFLSRLLFTPAVGGHHTLSRAEECIWMETSHACAQIRSQEIHALL